MTTPKMLTTILSIALFAPIAAVADIIFLDPTHYTSFDDSPFKSVQFLDFHLEDFEDGEFNQLDATITGGSVIDPGEFTDSVDKDDGKLDGFGREGHSFGSTQTIRIEFSGGDVGLPTYFGVVWTDGGRNELHKDGQTDTNFRYFGKDGRLIASSSGYFGDGRTDGTTADDLFLGIIADRQIGAVEIRTINEDFGDLEIDHIQYGNVPEPNTLCLLAIGTLAYIRRSRSA